MSATANSSGSAPFAPGKSIVIVGMPGAGKSSIGRKLAVRLGVPFFDSDAEIETAAGMSVKQIFERFGEDEFRKGERRVIARLLGQPPHVLATGGGAFMEKETRDLIRTRAVSIWLHADVEILLERATRRNDRPLLQGGDLRELMMGLLTKREPIYAEADLKI